MSNSTGSTGVVYPMLTTNGLAPRYERLRLHSNPPGAGTPGATPSDSPAGAATPSPAPVPSAPTVPSTQPSEWDGKVESLPAQVQKLIGDLRAEAGNARVSAKQIAADEARTELLKQLGLVKDGDTAPDPAKVTEQVTAAQEAARAAQVELAVFRAAPGLKADPTALLDSRAFLAKVADLDPQATDFAARVSAAITAAVADNSKLAAAPVVAGPSSVDHAGGSGEPNDPATSAAPGRARMAAAYASHSR